MKTYGTLVDGIADLHAKYQLAFAAVPKYALQGQWLPTAVDTTTSAVKTDRPVIVAVGANYATGHRKLPSSRSAVHRKDAPWVEDDLKSQRQRVLRFLHACVAGRVKRHWNGLLAFDPHQNYHTSVVERLGENPHFVMTNFSPWITALDWGPIRDKSLEDLFSILAGPGFGPGGLWGYFKDLKRCVGRDAIWIGHGNAEIYGLFRLLCWKLDIEEWFFDSNLSHPSHMIKTPATRKPMDKK